MESEPPTYDRQIKKNWQYIFSVEFSEDVMILITNKLLL